MKEEGGNCVYLWFEQLIFPIMLIILSLICCYQTTFGCTEEIAEFLHKINMFKSHRFFSH